MEVGLFCHPDDIAARLDLGAFRTSGLRRLIVNVLYHDWACHAPLSSARPLRRERGGVSAVPMHAVYPPGLAPRPCGDSHLAAVMANAADADIAVDAWTVGLHRDDLASACEPDLSTVVDAFGTRQSSWLCPSSPASMQYLEAHARDIAAHGFARLVLEGCHYPLLPHGGAHERDLSRLPETVMSQLELCFCKACCARYAAAGVEPEQFAATIRQDVGDTVGHRTGTSLAIVPALRRQRVLELLSAIRAAAPQMDTMFADQPAIAGAAFRTGEPGRRRIADIHAAAGIDPSAIATATSRMLALAYFRSPRDLAEHIEAYLDAGVPASSLTVALRATPPDCDSIADMREKLRLIAALGVDEVAFYELTQMDAADLALTREAIEVAAAT